MKKVLAVATNSDVEVKGSKTGLWLSELTHFLDAIEAEGWDYDIASPKGGKIPLDEGSLKRGKNDSANKKYLGDARFNEKLANSLKCSEVDASQYDAIYLSGGHGTIFDFRQSEDLQRVLTEFYSDAKIVSGVCHGVSGIVDTKDRDGNLIIRDRVVTGFSNFEDRLSGVLKHMPFLLESELKRNGAKYVKNFLPFTQRVEVDGRLVTGQNPQSARAVGVKVAERLKQSAKAATGTPAEPEKPQRSEQSPDAPN